jgi:CheY-like chemotaxis protein
MENQLAILVVDDEAMVQLLAKTALDAANFNTLVASNADEAIEILENGTIFKLSSRMCRCRAQWTECVWRTLCVTVGHLSRLS